MLAKLIERRNALKDESGFTLIELLVVLIIIGILLAIAVPSYLHFKDQANKKAAMSDVRQAMPAAESYYQDNNSYKGMEVAGALTGIDAGIDIDKVTVTAAFDGYCLQKTVGGFTANVHGPGGKVLLADDPAYTACA